MQLGISSAIMMCLEWWVYEVMIIMSGIIGVNEQACQLIVINIATLVFCIAQGIQYSASNYIGQAIGRSEVRKARAYMRVINHTSFIIFTAIFVCVFMNTKLFASVFTQNQ